MSTEKNQSDIAEVRDQLSLDFADGAYLNNIGANLGMDRPVFGFADDTWRALVKAIALDYKQIANKFRDVLAILFGPQYTQTTSLSTNSIVGDRVIFVNDTKKLPQLGTLILDEDTNDEETVEYCFIDRSNNAIFLNSPLGVAHLARTQDAITNVLAYFADTATLLVSDSSSFPTTDFPYPIVLGGGTSAEEVVLVSSNDIINNTLGLFLPPVTQPRTSPSTTAIFTDLIQAYPAGSVFLIVDDATQFPDAGLVKVGASTTSYTTTAISANLTTLTVAASTFDDDQLAGVVIRFDGNVTTALAGHEIYVATNTSASGVIRTASNLPALTAIGDTFTIYPVVEYTSIDRDENVLVLTRPIDDDLSFAIGATVELLQSEETASLATVKVAGAGWDLIQARPKILELLIPEDLNDEGNLRSASYLHTVAGIGAATTLSDPTAVGAPGVTVVDSSAFPLVGVLTIDLGGSNEEQVGYYIQSPGKLVSATQSLSIAHLAGETVTLYEPAHSGTTDLLIGDYNAVKGEDTFPGPYVYSVAEQAPTATVALTALDATLPGPSILAITQEVNTSALEIEDASTWDRVNFPYTVLVGDGTGNREEVTVNDLNFATRTSTTLATAASISDTTLELTALSGGAAGDAADFPNANGYRVIIDRGTASEEIVYVIGTATGPDRLLLEDPIVSAHLLGAPVELVSDVITTNTLTDDHVGVILRGLRSTAQNGGASYPTRAQAAVAAAETTKPQISSFDVVSATGLDVQGGTVLLNFGFNKITEEGITSALVSAGATSVTAPGASAFPSTGEFVVTIAPDTVLEERAIVTSRTGDTLTIDFGVKNTHASGTVVRYAPGSPEVVTYTDITSNTLSFSSPIVLQSSHSKEEQVIDSSTTSDPRENGYDFPLRMPPDLLTRLQLIIDLIRAAGVQVEIIEQR